MARKTVRSFLTGEQPAPPATVVAPNPVLRSVRRLRAVIELAERTGRFEHSLACDLKELANELERQCN